jgi:hypothetical protein
MVSTDHFRQELLAQLARAATQGHDVIVNSGEPTAPFPEEVHRQLLAVTPCKLSSTWATR